jgi:hypothetical protein
MTQGPAMGGTKPRCKGELFHKTSSCMSILGGALTLVNHKGVEASIGIIAMQQARKILKNNFGSTHIETLTPSNP